MSPKDPHGEDGLPEEWDRLLDLDELEDPQRSVGPPPPAGSAEHPAFPLLTASCADLVAILLPCTLALVALRLDGLPVSLAAAPWALGLGALWWVFAAAILLRVRRGTPGMLAAGLVYREEPAGGRLWRSMVVALLAALTLGLPLALFRRTAWRRLELVGPGGD